VMDLHPSDRGTEGTRQGTIFHHGNCYWPCAPSGLFAQVPLVRGASAEETLAHDEAAAELARYKLSRISADDADGYHRVMCPALLGKVHCPLRKSSMMLDLAHAEVLAAPPSRPSPPGGLQPALTTACWDPTTYWSPTCAADSSSDRHAGNKGAGSWVLFQ
jgi:hypothetical protein